ncbi:PorV/PorQ family protein [Balneolaceae bacterium ANBcel3]|nr:PorV/PorQ family protein [Balneolaceae bacterium ANBcel3]
MKNKRFYLPVLFILIFSVWGAESMAQSIFPSFGSSRSGTSGFQFAKIGVDARSAGMAYSNIADATDASSLFWNPALASQMNSHQFLLGHTSYFADISLNYGAYVHRFGNMALGGSLTYLDSGDMEETTEFHPYGTGRTFRSIHMAAGLTFSQQLTNLFSYGLTLKYLHESIEEVSTHTAVLDIGFFYRVGNTGLRFAVGVNNFGFDASPGGETRRIPGPHEGDRETDEDGYIVYRDFEEISPPTTFTIGAAYDVYQTEWMNVLLTGQIINPNDNAERLSLGTEFQFMNQFFARGGYEFGVDEIYLPNFGVGVKLPVRSYSMELDYGFAARERLGTLHRISLKFNL